MSIKWSVVRLEEGSIFQEGYVNPTQKKPEYFDGDVKWLRAVDLNNGYVKETSRTLTQAGFESAGKSALLFEPGTLAISKSGTIGRIGILQNYMCGNRAVINIKVDEAKWNGRFIFYVLLANRPTIENLSIGSVQKNLYTSALGSLEFQLPDRQSQNTIANILSSLDEKIELNRQTNQTLEEMAQAVFKSWFVDFEPTRAKIKATQNGQDPTRAAMAALAGKTVDQLDTLSPEQIKTLTATAALFPETLTNSELGGIPEGWNIGSVGDIASAKGGYAFKGKSFVDDGHPVVKIKNITGDGRVDLTGAVCVDDKQASSSERFKLSDGDLLMAMTGATVGKIGFVITGGQAVYLNQRVAKFESEKFGRKISWFLFCCFSRSSILDSIVGAAQGSAQPNISSSGIESTQLILPSNNLIDEFSDKADALFEKWLCNIGENAELEQLRDTLLPKLLSGEIDVSNPKEAAQ